MSPGPTPGRVLIGVAGFGQTGDALSVLQHRGLELIPNLTAATLTEDQLMGLVGDVDAIIAGTEPITARVLAAAPRLRIVARRGVGFDSVDLAAATARRVVVTVTTGVLTDAVADHAWALLLAVARRVAQFDRLVKSGGWERTLSLEVSGRTLGIVGFGAIGRAVARRGVGFGMRILAYDTVPYPAAAKALGVTLCDLDALLAASDFVTLHVPLGLQTRGLIGETALRHMKPTAVLINTSRGGVIDEAALVDALRAHRIAGAGLDVFEHEPHPNPALVQLENVVATPHVASFTGDTLARMDRSCADAVVAVFAGERPAHVANPDVYR
jgi:lactate dehydrogenase-like 2-hydroxyacid dehydrogenase